MRKRHTLTQVYDNVEYWSHRGNELGKYTEMKKQNILEALKPLSFSSVLEIGSGQGELTRLILDNFPVEKYECVDISRLYLAQLPNNPILKKTNSDFLNYYTNERFDLVIAAHVLLHIEHENLLSFWVKMGELSKKYVCHIDPIKENIPRKWEYYNFPHDYTQLHPESKFKQVERDSGIWLVKK